LKHWGGFYGFNRRCVAPRAGAWIETERDMIVLKDDGVAPRAGAWIETARASLHHQWGHVAPRAGAWIETFRAGI